jgi:hypothetical protein
MCGSTLKCFASFHLTKHLKTPFLFSQGAYNKYASIDAKWDDTVAFDNLRADGSGGNEVTFGSTLTGLGNTVHTYSTNATTY